jgi:hypothetical protein
MPMIALATLVVVTDLPHARPTVKQRVFEAVRRRGNRRRYPPEHHLHDRTVVIVDALMEKQLGFHPAEIMAY